MGRARALPLLAAVSLWACDAETVAPGLEGMLSLHVIAGAGPASGIDAGTVHIEGPTPRTVSILPGEEKTIEGLLPGTYTVSLEGFQAGRLAEFGQTTVTVVAGQNRRADLRLESFVPASIDVPAEVPAYQIFTAQLDPVPGATSYCIEHADNPAFVCPTPCVTPRRRVPLLCNRARTTSGATQPTASARRGSRPPRRRLP